MGVFSSILVAQQTRHPLLEDWVSIPIYLFIWKGASDKLKWFEDRFNELVIAIGEQAWSEWVQEIIMQTNCLTTHRIYDRIYDYLLHMYGALYLARDGWIVQLQKMNDGGPDIEARRGVELCVMECKFKHTSKKVETLFWRFDFAARKCSEKTAIISSSQFRFPGLEASKELSPEHCTATKEFVSKVYKNPKQIIKAVFEDLRFEYYPELGPATTIDSQENNANHSAQGFLQNGLTKVLKDKAKQLRAIKYQKHQKILFLVYSPTHQISCALDRGFNGRD